MREAISHLEHVLAARDVSPLELTSALAGVCDQLQARIDEVEREHAGAIPSPPTRTLGLAEDVDRLRREWIALLELADEALAASELLHDPPLGELLAFARGEAVALAGRLRAHGDIGAVTTGAPPLRSREFPR